MRREAALSAFDDAPPIEQLRDAVVSRTVSLSAVSEVRVSNVDKRSETGELPVRLCNYTDVYKNDYITDDLEFMRATASRAEIARFGLRIGDVIITKDSESPNDIGIPSLVDSATDDLVCGYHLAMVRPSQKEIDSTFLAKQLAQPAIARYFGQQANGSTRYGLSITSIERTPIWLPSIEVQRTTSEVARVLDIAIENSAGVISKLLALRLGLIADLFCFGIGKDGTLRSNSDAVETKLGWMPRTWHLRPLEAISHLITSGSRGWARYYSEDGAKFIRIGNLTREHINLRLGDLVHVTPPRGQEGLRTAVQAGDLLISITADLGIVGSVPEDFGEAYVNQHIALVRPNGNAVNPRWPAHYLSSRRAQAFFSRLNDQGAKAGLNLPAVARIEIPLPPKDEQDAIVEILDGLDAQIVHFRVEHNKLRDVRKGLFADMFSGHAPVLAPVEGGR